MHSLPSDAAATPRLLRAINVAATAHDGHYRKGTTIPYVSHVFGVMFLASQQNLGALFDPREAEDILIACLLHDTLEDVPDKYSAAHMEADFGANVLSLVKAVTKDDSLSDWQARADAYLAHLNTAPLGAVIVSACDKLHNLSSILADHEVLGERIWERFNSGKHKQLWWYESVFDLSEKRLKEAASPDSTNQELSLITDFRSKLAILRQLVAQSH